MVQSNINTCVQTTIITALMHQRQMMAQSNDLPRPRQLLITLSPTLCAALVASIKKTSKTYAQMEALAKGKQQQGQAQEEQEGQDTLLDGAPGAPLWWPQISDKGRVSCVAYEATCKRASLLKL